MDSLDVEGLAVGYSDGKALEQYKQLLQAQLRLAAENTRLPRAGNSLTTALIVSQSLAGARETIRDLMSTLQRAGEKATAAAAVRAAIPFVNISTALQQPSAAFDEQLLSMAIASDAALSLPRRKTAD